MTTILRIYDPAECDEHGVPLDWERCRACEGTGNIARLAGIAKSYTVDDMARPEVFDGEPQPCARCDGHGSLKAAALAALKQHVWRRGGQHPEDPVTRCEGCWHPMSDGASEFQEDALPSLQRGDEPLGENWSPCDEGCRHAGPTRHMLAVPSGWYSSPQDAVYGDHPAGAAVEASWRAVDVRAGMLAKRGGMDPTKGPLVARPFDQRAPNLAILCLRCWATSQRHESGGEG